MAVKYTLNVLRYVQPTAYLQLETEIHTAERGGRGEGEGETEGKGEKVGEDETEEERETVEGGVE